MKTHLTLILAIIALLAGAAAEAKYSGGTGEPNNPYQIATAEDLNDIGNHEEDWNKHFILINDVNLAQYTGAQFKRIGTDWQNPFAGVFDGNDHIISNFTYISSVTDYVGLFGYTSGSEIRNLGLINVNVLGHIWVGGLIGWNVGSVLNSYVTGDVRGNGDWYAGGLIGFNEGSVLNSYAIVNVVGWFGAGGLIGENRGTISNSYSNGSVSGFSSIGGLAGRNHGGISNSYATGSASGNSSIGGLIGWNISSVLNSYSTGSVSANYWAGGLIGFTNEGSGPVSNSHWDTQTSGQTTSDGGTGKTTAEMKQISTFANWDFVETWGIEDNQTYPFLKLTYPVGDLNYDKVVNFLDFAILAEHWLEGTGQ